MKLGRAFSYFWLAVFSLALNAQQPQLAAANTTKNSQPPTSGTGDLTAAHTLAPTVITVTASREADEGVCAMGSSYRLAIGLLHTNPVCKSNRPPQQETTP